MWYVCSSHGGLNGFATPKHGNGQSSSVLDWAYPQAGSPERPGSASKSRHGKQSIVAAYGTTDKVPSIHFLAAGLSLAALAGHSITEGWTAADGIVSHASDISRSAVPLYFTAALKGAAAGILTGFFCRQKPVQAGTVAAVVVLLAPIAAMVTLAQVPLGRTPSDFVLDPSAVTSKVAAAVSGVLVFLSLSVLTQIAGRLNQQASVKGVFVGIVCAGFIFAARGL